MDIPRIFVVEDEFIIADDIREGLRDIGYTVCGMAASGEDALEKIGGAGADLVLMDIFLKGGMDGIEAAEHIRSAYHLPVVYLTAYATPDILARAKITGAFGYLIKPFTDRELHVAVEMAIHNHQMCQERERLIEDLEAALAKVRTLSGMLPICSQCKKIRDDKGYWNQIEAYLAEHSEAEFSHGLCPDCMTDLYGKESWFKNIGRDEKKKRF